MHAVLVIHYTRPDTRAWNFISTRLEDPKLELKILAQSRSLHVLSVTHPDPCLYTRIFDLLREDPGTELKEAYWFGSPHNYHLNGESAGWIEEYP